MIHSPPFEFAGWICVDLTVQVQFSPVFECSWIFIEWMPFIHWSPIVCGFWYHHDFIIEWQQFDWFLLMLTNDWGLSALVNMLICWSLIYTQLNITIFSSLQTSEFNSVMWTTNHILWHYYQYYHCTWPAVPMNPPKIWSLCRIWALRECSVVRIM